MAATTVMAKPRSPAWLMAGLLVLVTIALYWPAMRCGFVSADDPLDVTQNVHVNKGLTWEGIRWAFLKPMDYPGWQPLTMVSHMVACQVFGLNPWGHHFANVLIHALNAGLVFVLLKEMTGALWRSLLVAALFAFHPLRVESVAWVTQRRDVLSPFFGLLSLIAYARYVEQARVSNQSSVFSNQSSGGPATGRRSFVAGLWKVDRSLITDHRLLFYLLSLLFFAFGLMSKPVVVTWPFVMLLLDYWPLRRFELSTLNSQPSAILRLVREKTPFFALTAMMCVLAVVVQKRQGYLAEVESMPVGARLGNALISYCRYLGKMFWPTDLAIYYLHPGHWPLGEVLLAGGLILGVSVLVWVQRRRAPYLLVGWLWYCGTLVPMSQVVQLLSQAMADRWTYVPSLGVLILIVWGACQLTRCWRYQVLALSVAGGAAILLCLASTRQQIGYWRDSEALFRRSTEVMPNNPITRHAFGSALLEKGRFDEAILQFEETIRLRPGYAFAHRNLGAALLQKGQIDLAILQFQEAVRLNPSSAEVHYNLGVALVKKGRMDEAIRQLQEATRLEPDDADTHYNLGTAFFQQGRVGEAIHHFQEATRLRPDHAEAHNNLGTALGLNGQTDEAIRQFQEALRIKPDYADARKNLNIVLATRVQSSPPPSATNR